MATSLLSPPIGTPKTPFLQASKLSFASSVPVRRWRFNSPMASAKKDPNSPIKKDPNSPMASSEDPINEGPTDDDKNSFKYLYGLPPSHLNSLITKQKYARPQTESVTEESISYLEDIKKEILTGLPPSHLNALITKQKYARPQTESVTEESISYLANEEVKKEIISYRGNFANHYGLVSASGMSERAPPGYILNTTGEEQQNSFPLKRLSWRGRYKGKPLPRPPDMTSQFFFDRVIFLEDPIVPPVAELIIAQFMWLDRDDSSKPIYLYINSEGNEDEEGQVLASEANTYAIADIMAACKSKVYTIHMGVADGLAALLLSLGVKGRRGLQPHSITQLSLPQVPRSSGVATDMYHMGKAVDGSTETFLDLLSKGTGKPTEELYRDLQEGPKFFDPQGAIDYGLADRIVGAAELGFGNVKKKGGNPVLAAKKAEAAELRAMRRARLAESKGKANAQAPAPSVA